MANELLLLWLAAFPLMGSPGPATMSLAGLGMAFGFRSSLSYLVGIIAGTTGVLLMIATGVTTLILAQPVFLTALTILAGIYILYLAWKIATAPVGPLAPRSEQAPAFVPGFSLAIANPKAFAAIGAVYAGHTVVADDLTADAVYKLAALALVIVIVNTAWLAFGAIFSRILTNPAIGRAVNVLFAVMLVTSVAFALLAAE
ncbi:threonine/homoserine/homoserine lactone efflux protein [Rhodopseudomonas julia]|uniref:Threonine/homoserine/homoserine lactone efflux protein n=1 Tax=Rhodopseudomonas julia TaxID=200617 RepID=A0ABU0C5R4_9BRAD|nr:LysE family transporter [Rhodopseudomonas julia]MDQ0325858.1 threonine/homoserine/homoserine lactone efflux protein [Rhodopseudomonas julia]